MYREVIIRGVPVLQRVARRVRGRFMPSALTLIYHRVVDLPSDPQLLAVTPKHFAEHLEILRRSAHPLSLTRLVAGLRARALPRRGVVITFDDGYADNLHHAGPLLERYDTPATVFVTTGHIGCQREFWWDELERLLLQPGTLPASLDLSIHTRTHHYELGTGTSYSEEDYRRYRAWHIEESDDPGPRQRLYWALYEQLHSLAPEEQRNVVERLRIWAGAQPTGRITHRVMTLDEVAQLDKSGQMEVGAHTVTHPALATLPLAAQAEEIRQSKTSLEELLGHPVVSFAYPYGSISPETVALVRDIGFDGACCSHPDVVWPNADCFQLPRLVVRDWDGETFGRWLGGWLSG